jgi:phage gpG-like protein
MGRINFEIRGARELKNRLKEFNGDLPESVDEVLRINADELVRNARRRAPTRRNAGEGERAGTLRQSINVQKAENLSYNVGSNVFYAAYMEFGTGNLAASYVAGLPEEFQELAIQYKAEPRKRLINIAPRPYLYPSYLEQIPILIEDLRQDLNTI